METVRNALTSKLIDSLYTEAMVLADEARAYFDSHGRSDRMGLDAIARVGFSCESLKVTTRLMHVIAWLLNQRAVAAGEIDSEQASSAERRLGEALESDDVILQQLPEAALSLITASQDLYERVKRLEAGQLSEDPAPSPALSLLSRLQSSI